MKNQKRDYAVDKLIMDLFASLTKKGRKRFIDGLTKKEKKQLLIMIQKRIRIDARCQHCHKRVTEGMTCCVSCADERGP